MVSVAWKCATQSKYIDKTEPDRNRLSTVWINFVTFYNEKMEFCMCRSSVIFCVQVAGETALKCSRNVSIKRKLSNKTARRVKTSLRNKFQHIYSNISRRFLSIDN